MRGRNKRFNASRNPIFSKIPLTNVVIDNLHLFLRVADVLIDHLIVELRRLDGIEKQSKLSSFDKRKYQHLVSYENFVSSLGIPGFSFYIGQTSKKLKCRTLTGPEKLKLFKAIKIHDVLGQQADQNTVKIQHLWDEMLALNQLYSRRPEELTVELIDEFAQRSREWGRSFIGVYHTASVTPYIHALMNHVSEFMKLHGGIL